MYEIENERVGTFLAQLRKQQGFTQRELAERLFVSDKAVSKWERGLSMPDIALLMPLAELLGVTTTELLSGQRINEPELLNIQEVEKLVAGTIQLSAKEQQQRNQRRKRRIWIYIACVAIAALEFIGLVALGFSFDEVWQDIALVEGMCLGFGGWFCLFVKETLPTYYDENKVSTYSDGIFRMNMAGIRFNNSNWPHILRAGRTWLLIVPIVFPLLYFVVRWFFPAVWEVGELAFVLIACLGFFIPMMIAGKRYE
ncbi:Helix-turn-helix [Sporobacter termitidis DSM 10068]|uniref:Helix-turn-helix n=1 Tax=Sporobacter termitidis DSM 10068 TaxID=1123282 RepID=A0A1M5XVZ0_9FIRM|nr:helix-turn-helix transcriptional regulator [Sporobacter termitidis]SHI03423.1 Helix-turn-helix [Sporobacter termitidis DSM 10068]